MHLGLDIDTDCSGVGGSETFTRMSIEGARAYGLDIPEGALRFHSASEIDAKRINVLKTMPHGAAHIWNNLNKKVHPRALEQLQKLRPPTSCEHKKVDKDRLFQFRQAQEQYLRRRARRCFNMAAAFL